MKQNLVVVGGRSAAGAFFAAAVVLAGSQPGCLNQDEPTAQLHALFPVQAPHVLGGVAAEPFEQVAGGFAVAAPGGKPLEAAEAALSRRGGLRMTLPREAAREIRFQLPGGFSIAVRELGARGKARLSGRAVVNERHNGTSFWTANPSGYEEWLLVEPENEDTPVAAWEVEGATLRLHSGQDLAGGGEEAVEVLDTEGTPRITVKAPAAYGAGGVPVKVALRVTGNRIALHLRDPPRATPGGVAGTVLIDPLWQVAGAMAAARYDCHAVAEREGAGGRRRRRPPGLGRTVRRGE